MLTVGGVFKRMRMDNPNNEYPLFTDAFTDSYYAAFKTAKEVQSLYQIIEPNFRIRPEDTAVQNIPVAAHDEFVCSVIRTANYTRESGKDYPTTSSSDKIRPRDEPESVYAVDQGGHYGPPAKKTNVGKDKTPTAKAKLSAVRKCQGCNRQHHGKCWFAGEPGKRPPHPDYNNSGQPWETSPVGQAYATASPPQAALQAERCISAGVMVEFNYPTRPWKRPGDNPTGTEVHSTAGKADIRPLSPFVIEYYVLSRRAQSLRLTGTMLLDTGACCDSYISLEMGQRLSREGFHRGSIPPKVACSCYKECVTITTFILIPELYLTLPNGHFLTLANVKLIELPKMKGYDIIFGVPDLIRHNLITVTNGLLNQPVETPEVRAGEEASTAIRLGATPDASAGPRWVIPPPGVPQEDPSSVWVYSLSEEVPDDQSSLQQGHSVEGSLHITDIFGHVENDDPIEDVYSELDETLNSHGIKDAAMEMPTNIEGPESLQTALRAKLKQYEFIFRTQVPRTPAKITPLKLEVDDYAWHHKKYNFGIRTGRSAAQTAEIVRQVTLMLELGIIRPSKAKRWSHIILTPKPNGLWRMVQDFRELNQCIIARTGYLPKIRDILTFIGEAKAVYFIVMDFTSGFHQAPLDPESYIYTAFWTSIGIFEWTRVPMGPTDSPKYFQETLMHEVLQGLVMNICALYMDDLIIFGKTEEELLERLELVLNALARHGITLNPKKCKFGLKQIEYLGYLVDSEGTRFSEAKVERITNFPKPIVAKQVRSFVGLANYFTEHVEGMADHLLPLRQLLDNIDSRKPVVWTPEATLAFDTVKAMIEGHQKLYFYDVSHGEVCVFTDASLTGIGGYVCQRQPNTDGTVKEYPLGYISRALNATERRWNTTERECYAMIVTLRKQHHLLSGVEFTLYTDHDNLLYIKDPPSAKVLRWKLVMQQYNMKLQFIPGKDNVVADVLSRIYLITVEGENTPGLPPTIPTPTCVRSLSKETYELILQAHNSRVGHGDGHKTAELLVRLGHSWPGMTADIREFKQMCPTCQMMDTKRPSNHPSPFSESSGRPHERINIDTLTTTPADAAGYSMVLVIVDCFTRWVELYPLKSLNAEEAARCLLQHFGRFGAPLEIFSDNATQFINETMTYLERLEGFNHYSITPYSHEENGMVERQNKEVLRHLRAYVFDNKVARNWSLILPFIQRIMNTTRNRVTNYEPAELLFGPAVNLQRFALQSNPSPTTFEGCPIDWIRKQHILQTRALEIAETLQYEHNVARLANATPPTIFPVNSHVLLDEGNSQTGPGRTNKLHMHKRGPFEVTYIVGNNYYIRHLSSHRELVVQSNRLCEFVCPPNTTAIEVANRDTQTYTVDKIISARMNGKKESWTFQVLFTGDPTPKQLPWKEVKQLQACHDYLRSINKANLIPPAYQEGDTPAPDEQPVMPARGQHKNRPTQPDQLPSTDVRRFVPQPTIQTVPSTTEVTIQPAVTDIPSAPIETVSSTEISNPATVSRETNTSPDIPHPPAGAQPRRKSRFTRR
jgi:hypothetical protein